MWLHEIYGLHLRLVFVLVLLLTRLSNLSNCSNTERKKKKEREWNFQVKKKNKLSSSTAKKTTNYLKTSWFSQQRANFISVDHITFPNWKIEFAFLSLECGQIDQCIHSSRVHFRWNVNLCINHAKFWVKIYLNLPRNYAIYIL